MTTKTDLPPLPERFDCTNGSAQWCYGCYTMTRDDLGDYVLAEDYDALRNASEALQAEIEAMRAEVERLNRILGRIVEGDGDSNLTIRAGTDAFAAAREYLLRDQEEGHE